MLADKIPCFIFGLLFGVCIADWNAVVTSLGIVLDKRLGVRVYIVQPFVLLIVFAAESSAHFLLDTTQESRGSVEGL